MAMYVTDSCDEYTVVPEYKSPLISLKNYTCITAVGMQISSYYTCV